MIGGVSLSYIDLIDKADKKSRSTSIAIKIRDMMKDLRLSSNEETSRRWIWELLQNAKDVSHANLKTKVEIELDVNNRYLKFSHNGKPFTAENITFLIGQVSSKEQQPYSGVGVKETGKFGTGFLTTHLLSEVVAVDGILKEDNKPYKRFRLNLDRSGKDIETIIDSVESSLEELKKVEYSDDIDDYLPDDFNTSFTYMLNSLGVEVAKRGIQDLHSLVPYTLIFVPNIESIFIKNERITFSLDEKIVKVDENISIYSVLKNSDCVQYEYKIMVAKYNDISIAFEIENLNGKIVLKEFANDISRLFCDFPLIGTEKLAFPFVINCPRFNPNEPRNGVYLTDKSDELIDENKDIMKIGLKIFCDILDFSSVNQWGNMHLFGVNINSIINVDWLSKDWFRNEITTPIKNKLLNTPIIDTENGERISIKIDNKLQVLFPNHRDMNIRVGLFELGMDIYPHKLPLRSEIENWNKVIWTECKKLDFENLTTMIQKQENIKNLKCRLSKTDNPFIWLNSYYKLLNEEKIFIENIVADKYAVIPNQNGKFVKRTEVFIDKNIDEVLKDVLVLVGEDCREYLLSNEIETGEGIKYYVRDSSFIISRINELLPNCKPSIKLEASIKLISIFANNAEFPKERQLIYDFCIKIFPNHLNGKLPIKIWHEQIWEKADNIILKNIVLEIAKHKNIENLVEILDFEDSGLCINWLNSVIEFLSKEYSHLFNNENYAILPNQNGHFCTRDNLNLDDDSIDEELKDISSSLGYDFREQLLDKRIYLSFPESRTISIKELAEKITALVRGKWNDLLKDSITKQALRELLFWFNENEYKAKEFFTDLYKYKHRFLEDSEIIESIDKANRFDEIMAKYKIDDYEKLERVLESGSLNNPQLNMEKLVLNEELLVQLGISSQEELDAAFGSGIFSENFVHLSESSSYKFEFVQKLIERSINNVFTHLKSKSEYDFSELIELDKTIFIIKKHNKEMYLIVRPSDYKQIILYYESEKDVLDYEKDWEIWVDNESDPPQKITFGKILKLTGINKIPLKRIR